MAWSNVNPNGERRGCAANGHNGTDFRPIYKISKFGQRFAPETRFVRSSGIRLFRQAASRAEIGIPTFMTTVRRPTTKTAVLAAADCAAASAAKARLLLPAGVRPFQLNWPYII